MSYKWQNRPNSDEQETYLAIGSICSQWNYMEWAIGGIARALLLLSLADQYIVLRHFGNISITDLITDLAARDHPNSKVQECVAAACQAFEICRSNRNLIVHGKIRSDATYDEARNMRVEKSIRTVPNSRIPHAREFSITLEEMHQFSDALEDWAMFMARVSWHIEAENYNAGKVELDGFRGEGAAIKIPLPMKPPNPKKFAENRKK